jgi:hypothetical protein
MLSPFGLPTPEYLIVKQTRCCFISWTGFEVGSRVELRGPLPFGAPDLPPAIFAFRCVPWAAAVPGTTI